MTKSNIYHRKIQRIIKFPKTVIIFSHFLVQVTKEVITYSGMKSKYNLDKKKKNDGGMEILTEDKKLKETRPRSLRVVATMMCCRSPTIRTLIVQELPAAASEIHCRI